ncbi:Outer membrane receptor proteins, mostly Fe transport [Pseudarcicella hirudinis]|uniref:Outer membrane receptor proteins, mostly Fe transport n=1 Tax=Pseudarcicella hirudinis TaxID=1079859 RepID=A0A1I5XG05_9BACT|nr:TonB-dependent receptor [Pseudarcicella hirudinis]SFQ30597.1 Outer membrane receptor proteins, mostly Fe transport [Pseudarcicella hirudinis]
MKKLLLTLFLLTTGLGIFSSQAQDNLILISGKIIDKDSKEPLIGAGIQVKGTVTGSITDSKGAFALKTKLKFPFKLVFSYVGYATQEFEVKSLSDQLNIELVTQSILGQEVVVTASRVEESILKSPVAIEKLDIRAIKEAAAPSFYDALENVKGVQMITSSLTFKVPNTRGFNIPNNFRFMQLVDGVDMQAATLGVPLGNAIGPTELDIESVEITPGAASALYGMNAINGLANLQTKSPFRYQGLSVYQKVGVNHVDGVDHSASPLTETAIRYAKAFNNRFAFKVNFSYLKGTDWVSNSQNDQNPQNLTSANPRFPELSGINNPAYDAWNRYGDESNNNNTVTINYQGKTQGFNVRRTGYYEKDLVNPEIKNIKFDAGLFYKLNEKLELSYNYRYGLMDGTFQRGNKVRLDGVTVQNHKLELKSPVFTLRAYALIENTGDSYNVKPLADNLDLTHLSNKDWTTKFTNTLQAAVNSGVDLATAMQQARAAADQGRVLPGTPEFNALKSTIIGINNWDHAANVVGAPATGGAWMTQRSRTYHADLQYDLSSKIKIFDLLVGADYRLYEVIPDGNNFVDFSRPLAERTLPGGNNQYYTKYGAFAQLTKRFFDDKLKVTASGRVDNNPEFSPKFNPRVALVYTAAEKHNFRASFQNGYRFPALFEALSFVNNGNVRRVGGLARVNEGLGYLENSYTLASINNFTNAVNADVANGIKKTDAALKERGLLQVANLPAEQPEQINSFEVGYKSVLLNNKLSIDVDAYYNSYSNFLGQVEVAVPSSGKVGSDAAVQDMLIRANQTRYRVYTNAKNTYNSYGSSLGLTYNFYKKFTVSGNVNYNNIESNATPDIFVTGFNTPKWATNLSLSNREVVKNFGFNVVWRWQDAFLWESPLVNGTVAAYSNVDAQINLRVPQYKATVKLGASNVLNNRYIQYAGGPTIGGLYYLAVTIDGI